VLFTFHFVRVERVQHVRTFGQESLKRAQNVCCSCYKSCLQLNFSPKYLYSYLINYTFVICLFLVAFNPRNCYPKLNDCGYATKHRVLQPPRYS
jgi:hypothetical protein